MGDEGVGVGVEQRADEAVAGAGLADEQQEGPHGVELGTQPEAVDAGSHVRRGIAPEHRQRPHARRDPGSEAAHPVNVGTSHGDRED
jgi:hypothetical protein